MNIVVVTDCASLPLSDSQLVAQLRSCAGDGRIGCETLTPERFSTLELGAGDIVIAMDSADADGLR
ncbi:hypothetical protein, partial [Bifidobacterium cuniculi]